MDINTSTSINATPKSNNHHFKALKALIIMISVLIIILVIGFVGYKYIFKMNAIDAAYNTMINVSTLGIDPHTRTDGEKIFTGFYSLLSGVFFIAIIGIVMSYIFSLYINSR